MTLIYYDKESAEDNFYTRNTDYLNPLDNSIKAAMEKAYSMWQERKISDFDLILLQTEAIKELLLEISSHKNAIFEISMGKDL
jgi:hypothetical protein